ncbi:MAG TPA: hypothetical protein IGS51_19420, partial [Thermoleptolyngbya sp. M55_K2018_002]|nr:hypothetical protein [Thermoleptolyngbya sp. M55_K2018_002]
MQICLATGRKIRAREPNAAYPQAQDSDTLPMPSAYVIGLGKSGIAAARLLHRQGWQVTVSDSGCSDALQSMQQTLQAEGIAVLLGHRLEPDPAQMQRIVVSPGVRWDLPALETARALGIETIGEMELAWRSLSSIPWVAITGTNG